MSRGVENRGSFLGVPLNLRDELIAITDTDFAQSVGGAIADNSIDAASLCVCVKSHKGKGVNPHKLYELLPEGLRIETFRELQSHFSQTYPFGPDPLQTLPSRPDLDLILMT